MVEGWLTCAVLSPPPPCTLYTSAYYGLALATAYPGAALGMLDMHGCPRVAAAVASGELPAMYLPAVMSIHAMSTANYIWHENETAPHDLALHRAHPGAALGRLEMHGCPGDGRRGQQCMYLLFLLFLCWFTTWEPLMTSGTHETRSHTA